MYIYSIVGLEAKFMCMYNMYAIVIMGWKNLSRTFSNNAGYVYRISDRNVHSYSYNIMLGTVSGMVNLK